MADAVYKQAGAWLRQGALPLLCALVVLLLMVADPQALQGLRHAQFDQFQRWQPRTSADAGVVVVDIDEASLRKLGQWPWPRSQVAALLDALDQQGAAVVGLDMLLLEPDRTAPRAMAQQWQVPPTVRQALVALPDPDTVLAHSLANAPVALGMVLAQEESGTGSDKGVHRGAPSLPQAASTLPFRVVQLGEGAAQQLHSFDTARLPLPVLQQAASGLGALNFVADADGVVRRVPLVVSAQGQVLPSLVAEMLRLAQGAQNYVLQGTGTSGAGLQAVRIGKVPVATTAQGEVWVHYSEQPAPTMLPAWQVLAGTLAPGALADKWVLVGTSAQGLMDLRTTPLGQVLPGVAIHAQALEQMLTGQWLQRPAWALGLETVVAVLGCLFLGGVAVGTRAGVSAAWTALALGLAGWGAWWAFSRQHLLLHAAGPMLGMASTFLLCSVQRHLRTERQQRWIRTAFARYVSPNRVQYLVEHPEQLALGGQRQACSFIFTDLAGFTTLMESLDPAQAVQLLNTYLDRMVAIAFAHGGTLDRIMGDAVAVVFSAPLPQSDHRARALRCALEMAAFASDYARTVQAQQGIAFGHTRIGVHSGEVIVGNFGGSTLFDYRALGDAVNTASRLEGANKHLGTHLCVSGDTLAGCPDVAARPVGQLVLKGKTQALHVWEPLAAQAPGCAPLQDYLAAYQAMEALQADALAAWAALAQRYPHDPLVALHWLRQQRGEVGVRVVLAEK